MSQDYQIPRNSLAWLLVAQIAVVVPLIPHLPVWVLALGAACTAWRIQVYRERLPYPPWWVGGLLVVGGFLGVYLTYEALFHLPAMVTLLVIAFYFKLVEMRRRRDAYIVVFLTCFVIAMDFLHYRSIGMTLYLLFSLILTITALIGLTQSQGHKRPRHSVTLAAKLIIQALPLMLVAFIFFPRLPPLWHLPPSTDQATIGMSDSMSPGDFAALGRSARLAFRVTFDEDIPHPAALYWRGLVFDHFDGRRWRPGDTPRALKAPVRWFGENPADWEAGIETGGEPLRYQILLEPSHQTWLYSLPFASPGDWGIGLAHDIRLLHDKPLANSFLYSVESYPDFALDRRLPEWARQRNLQLPQRGNASARRLARQWALTSQGGAEVIQKALDYYQRSFTYTLQPPKLGIDSVDEFLFDTQQGFCEHFASSFVFLMRAAGLPARVVVGYQGGEINPQENYLLVHQYDAHAWAEVWIEGRGWTRVDPTAAVAPERVERGMAEMIAEREDFADASVSTIRRMAFLNTLRLKLDWINYAWTRWVLGYRSDLQRDFLSRWLGEFSAQRIAIALGVLSSLAIGLVAFVVFRQKTVKAIDPATRHYLRFCEKMEKIGIVRRPGEAPADFAARASREREDLADAIGRIQALYYQLIYAGDSACEQTLQALRRAIGGFRPGRSGRL